MHIGNKIIIKSYISLMATYNEAKKKYIKSLPLIPQTNPKIRPIFSFLTNCISKQFEPTIQEEISFYLKHHYELEDLQEGLGIASLLKFVKDLENIDGDILELGTYKGGTAIMLARFLKKINSKKKIYSCDTFSGLPDDDQFATQKNVKNLFSNNDYELVLKKIEKFDTSDKITLLKGLFNESLPEHLSENKFSFVLVDCDIYSSTKQGLDFVFPRLTKGGVIMFDDYDISNRENPFWGETKAVDEFCADKKIKLNLFPVPHIIK